VTFVGQQVKMILSANNILNQYPDHPLLAQSGRNQRAILFVLYVRFTPESGP